jgi:large subunit ribosomal protein L9
MELLLKKNVDKLGRVGDVVKVRDGFARNYLLPMGFAIPVTKANLILIEKEKELAAAEEHKRVSDLKDLAGRLKDASIRIEARANEQGHLFGSVAATQICAALVEKGFPIEERMIKLEQPLKEIGVFDVKLHLHAEAEATVKVWVIQAQPTV